MQPSDNNIQSIQIDEHKGIQVRFGEVKDCPDLSKRLLHIYERALSRYKENEKQIVRSTKDE